MFVLINHVLLVFTINSNILCCLNEGPILGPDLLHINEVKKVMLYH